MIFLSVESTSQLDGASHPWKKVKITSMAQKRLAHFGNDWSKVRNINFPLIYQLTSKCSFLFLKSCFFFLHAKIRNCLQIWFKIYKNISLQITFLKVFFLSFRYIFLMNQCLWYQKKAVNMSEVPVNNFPKIA